MEGAGRPPSGAQVAPLQLPCPQAPNPSCAYPRLEDFWKVLGDIPGASEPSSGPPNTLAAAVPQSSDAAPMRETPFQHIVDVREAHSSRAGSGTGRARTRTGTRAGRARPDACRELGARLRSRERAGRGAKRAGGRENSTGGGGGGTARGQAGVDARAERHDAKPARRRCRPLLGA